MGRMVPTEAKKADCCPVVLMGGPGGPGGPATPRAPEQIKNENK